MVRKRVEIMWSSKIGCSIEYKKILYDYWDTFLNFIYPRNIYCIICNISIDNDEKYSLCSKCRASLQFIEGKICIKCGKPLDEEYLLDKCHQCINSEYFYTNAISCMEYDDISKKIIYDLKYSKKRYISYHMAEIMRDIFAKSDIKDIDLIVPVPLHRQKERERTFNQSYLIGKYLGKMTDIDIDVTSLIRVKNTMTQNRLSREERIENLKDAFKVIRDDNIKDKNILLIDDVFTTGATVNECSRVLVEKGAGEVYVLTFATGRNV
jgi:ComF family protein